MNKLLHNQWQLRTSIACIGLFLFNASASATAVCEQRTNNTSEKLQECMTINGLVDHLKAFQQIADENTELPGTRFTNTQGYDASRDYIVKKMTDAGYRVYLQDVPMEITFITTPRIFEQKLPKAKNYVYNTDYAPLVNSGEGDITAKVQLPPGDIAGCNAADFTGFTPGNIALIQWGSHCHPRAGVANAISAGAKAVIMFSPAYGVIYGSLGSPIPSETTPVLLTSAEVGNELKDTIASGILPEVHIQFKMIKKTGSSQNIIAESRGGNPDHVVMVGAHLDSSAGNAGMNDNGSSSATILETALLMQKTNPVNKLRFAWWTGEELGLLGSDYYVEHLSPEEKGKISLYLNYEILGAPNGGRMIMGAGAIAPPGSEKISQLYADYFKAQGLKYFIFDPKLGDAAKRSDMAGFMKAGIPVGYLVTGAELPWNAILGRIFTDLPNRVNGLATHPCYHKACDKLTLAEGQLKDPNFDFDLYLQMSKAAAYAVFFYAMNPYSPA